MPLQCSSCDINFNDKRSLEVHYKYNHSQLLPEETEAAEPDAEHGSHTNQQRFFKYYHHNPSDNNHDEPSSVMTTISPDNADSRLFHLQQPVAPAQHATANSLYDQPPPSSHHHNHYKTYIMNSPQDYAPGSPVALQNANGVGGSYAFSEQRYHPYYKHEPSSFREVPRPTNEPTILRCDKCSMQCVSQEALQQHINMAHSTFPAGPHLFSSIFGNGSLLNGGVANPQAQIMDLDSHKVHSYHPPDGDDSKGSDHNTIDPWAREDRKYYHQQLPIAQLSGKVSAGSGSTPSPSPDFDSVSTTTANIEALQSGTRSLYYKNDSSDGCGTNSTPTQISSSDRKSSTGKSSSSKTFGGKILNDARRPKTYNCSACNKWFTSSGHLKRHYKTTLHKNAVKQSGAVDPATLPVSAHHHPQREPSPYPSSHQDKGSPTDKPATPPPLKPVVEAIPADYRNSQPHLPSTNAFINKHPNFMAGPSEAAGGLLHSSYNQSLPDVKAPSPTTPLQLQQQQMPPHSNHTSYLDFGPPMQQPFFRQPSPTALYPNFQSPHVSTTHQVITNSRTGKLTHDPVLTGCSAEVAAATDTNKLPSFACIQKNMVVWNAEQFLSTLDNGNVGGPFALNDGENASTTTLLMNMDVRVKQEHEEAQSPPLIQEDTNVSSSTEPMPEPLTDGRPLYSCDQCAKFFNKACYLTQHNKSFHSGFKPYKCTRCGKRFLDDVQYKIHEDKHAGDKPYKCEICPKAFNHKTDLRRHEFLHTDVKPYNCDICHKGFIRKDHMLKHRETHQNRKGVQRKCKREKLKKELDPMEITTC